MAPTQRAFAEHCGVTFKTVSGFPTHDGAKALGAFNEERSIARRITYVIDKEGIIRLVLEESQEMERHAREALEVVKQIEGKA